jgi:hypothetical protein
MTKSKVTYSNRQVKTQEDLFAPGDLDALLVGGVNQDDPFGYANVSARNSEFDGRTTDIIDNSLEGEEYEIDLEEDDDSETLGTINAVTFSQEGRFTGDGTFLVDVIATFNDIAGADYYEVEFYKVS